MLVLAQLIATLEPQTVRRFDEYLRVVDAQMTARAAGSESLAAQPAKIYPNSSGLEIGHGLIHDWTAVTTLPGVKKERVIAILEDFSKHAAIYPEVVSGRVERREGDRIFGFHRLRKKKVLEVNLEANYQLDRLPTPPSRYASRSVATKIVEVESAGTKSEHKLEPGHDHGFLWRLQTYWTLEDTPDGLWMEVRSISLTRNVPMGLGWAVKPIVKELPRESLEALLDATRRAATGGVPGGL